jgi:ParB-like chromosome segregation protein Spo0J
VPVKIKRFTDAVKSGLSVEYLSLSSLQQSERNARTHSQEQVKQLQRSILEFGWTNPILIDEQRAIIAGHGRLAAAQALAMAEVPTITLTGLSAAQKRALALADNKLALNAGWDEDLLRMELGDLKMADFDVSLIGFSDLELTTLLAEPIEPQAPDGFDSYDEDIETEHECPKCGYVFSGGKMVAKE